MVPGTGFAPFESATLLLILREPISLGPMEYSDEKLKICIAVERDELYALRERYRLVLNNLHKLPVIMKKR